jgi:hypothetical protein
VWVECNRPCEVKAVQGGVDAGKGHACLGLDPHGRLGDPAREAASTDESKEGLVIIHKIEGGNLIEEVFCRCKIGGVSRLIAQGLSDGFCRLCHESARSFFTVLSPLLFGQGESGDLILLSCHSFLYTQRVFG